MASESSFSIKVYILHYTTKKTKNSEGNLVRENVKFLSNFLTKVCITTLIIFRCKHVYILYGCRFNGCFKHHFIMKTCDMFYGCKFIWNVFALVFISA
jgi:hypothetical protein